MRKLLIVLTPLILFSCKSSHSLQGFVETDPIYISSPIGGKLINLNVSGGDQVTYGGELFVLHDAALVDQENVLKAELNRNKALLSDSSKGMRQSALEVLMANLEQAEASYNLAVKRFERAKKLSNKGAIDQDSYDNYNFDMIRLSAVVSEAKANIEDAKKGARSSLQEANEAAVTASEFNLRKIRTKLKQQHVYAPISGSILDTFYSTGEWVPAYTPIVSLVNPNNIYIKFYLPIAMLSDLKVGDIVAYKTFANNEVNEAKVTFISSTATYTPPMVFADNNNSKYVYLVKAKVAGDIKIALGQPVTVNWE